MPMRGSPTALRLEAQLLVKDDAVLVISMIGYTTQEVTVSDRTGVEVTLQEDVNVLGQVVVTGYQEVDKKLFTGSTVNLKGPDVKQDVSTT